MQSKALSNIRKKAHCLASPVYAVLLHAVSNRLAENLFEEVRNEKFEMRPDFHLCSEINSHAGIVGKLDML